MFFGDKGGDKHDLVTSHLSPRTQHFTMTEDISQFMKTCWLELKKLGSDCKGTPIGLFHDEKLAETVLPHVFKITFQRPLSKPPRRRHWASQGGPNPFKVHSCHIMWLGGPERSEGAAWWASGDRCHQADLLLWPLLAGGPHHGPHYWQHHQADLVGENLADHRIHKELQSPHEDHSKLDWEYLQRIDLVAHFLVCYH